MCVCWWNWSCTSVQRHLEQWFWDIGFRCPLFYLFNLNFMMLKLSQWGIYNIGFPSIWSVQQNWVCQVTRTGVSSFFQIQNKQPNSARQFHSQSTNSLHQFHFYPQDSPWALLCPLVHHAPRLHSCLARLPKLTGPACTGKYFLS